jgi:hypothetical protein
MPCPHRMSSFPATRWPTQQRTLYPLLCRMNERMCNSEPERVLSLDPAGCGCSTRGGSFLAAHAQPLPPRARGRGGGMRETCSGHPGMPQNAAGFRRASEREGRWGQTWGRGRTRGAAACLDDWWVPRPHPALRAAAAQLALARFSLRLRSRLLSHQERGASRPGRRASTCPRGPLAPGHPSD